MGTDLQERIRHRAYEIWESEGRPEHEDMRHWLLASKELGSSQEHDGNNEDDRDRAALLQGAGESGDFDARGIQRQQSSDAQKEVAITTGKQAARQTIKKTEGP